jgi:hypothetical protein
MGITTQGRNRWIRWDWVLLVVVLLLVPSSSWSGGPVAYYNAGWWPQLVRTLVGCGFDRFGFIIIVSFLLSILVFGDLETNFSKKGAVAEVVARSHFVVKNVNWPDSWWGEISQRGLLFDSEAQLLQISISWSNRLGRDIGKCFVFTS